MRLFVFLTITLLLSAGFLLPKGEAIAASMPEHGMSDVTPPDTETLNDLFGKLRRESDPQAAELIAERIRVQWRDSGSATGNLLMQWADEAIAAQKIGLAFDFLDQVTILLPDYVEGWNQRATLHFVLGNHAKSMADINRVLAIEPRHFGALAGMATILEVGGDERAALHAWVKVLEIYPANSEAQAKLGELAEKLADRKI